MTQNATDATLCFLLRGTPPTTVLLGYKQRGLGVGKVVGIGGRVEAGEEVVAAACREVYEEIGVTIDQALIRSVGSIFFEFPHRPAWNQIVHLFTATEWVGEPAESDEMIPAWFDVDALPFAQMWDDGRYWLPQLIAGETLYLTISYGEDNATVSSVRQSSPSSS
jgi:8-oxo-dGTP diphosphatase